MVLADPVEPDCRPITGLEEILEVRLHSNATGTKGKHVQILLKASFSHLTQQCTLLFCIYQLRHMAHFHPSIHMPKASVV